MEKAHQKTELVVLLLLVSTITGRCLPSKQEENWTMNWPSETNPQFYWPSEEQASSQDPTQFVYGTSHVWLPGNGNNYYGVEATLDVYGFNLDPDQLSQAGVWVINRGDGQPSSFNGFQAGWHISPAVNKDSHTHFFISWTSAGPNKDCLNMLCPGFKKTSSSVAPGDIITPVSDVTNGKKQYITLRLFKDKSSGDWHIHYGFNGAPKPVGYLPKSFLPGLIDKPVEIHFGGLVFHRKPKPSPPMGNGKFPASGSAASVSGLKLIDVDGNNHPVNTNLPANINLKMCYPISNIDSEGRFSYGGRGCDD